MLGLVFAQKQHSCFAWLAAATNLDGLPYLNFETVLGPGELTS